MGASPLAQVLRPLAGIFSDMENDNLLVGLETGDDAAVYRISDERAVILTVDFFTPVVDDPYSYGAVAAANAMSDVYAMGGEVAVALNICAFPGELDGKIISDIMRGGAEKVREAGGILAGGHTVNDREPKYGLAVMGFAHPGSIMTKGNALPGDLLIMTKPLGTGIITTAGKNQCAIPSHIDEAVTSMMQLNRTASEILVTMKIRCCTDITGFSLLGHASEIAEKSGTGLKISAPAIPFLTGAHRYAEEALFPGGTEKNRQAYEKNIRFSDAIEKKIRSLMFTPETSGGLLAAIPRSTIDHVLAGFEESGIFCRVIGEVIETRGIEVSS
jgi:selenide, water dikinase